MSSFIMSTETLATLADCIEKICNMGFNFFGFEAPDSMYLELHTCRYNINVEDVYGRLYNVNARAVNGRYKSANEPLDAEPYDFKNHATIVQRVRYVGGYIVEPWHYRFAKLLDCWLYQTDEDATARDPFRLAVRDLRDTLFGFIVRNTNHYDAAPWG